MIKILLTFIIAIIVLMATTLLFEWQFIIKHWTRQTLVLVFMIIQVAIYYLIIKEQIKDLK